MEIRESLFEIAGKPSILYNNTLVAQGGCKEYPLLFSMKKDRTITFVGNWDRIQDLLDADRLDPAILQQHPNIMTLSKFFP